MVRLLHLSDLHFSRDIDHFHFAEHNPEDIANLIIHKLMGKPPEYIVISGDLTYSGAITEFSFVQEFLLSLLDGFCLQPENNLLFVPGNRDIDKLEKYDREQPYIDFFHNVFNRPIVKASSLLIRNDITLIGYDAVSIQDADHPGFSDINGNDLRQAINEIKKDPFYNFDAPRIFVLHHHLLPVTQVKPLDENNQFGLILQSDSVQSILFEEDFHLVLHGHQHHPFLRIISNPTLKNSLVKKIYG